MQELKPVEPKTPKRLISVWRGNSFSVRNERYLVRNDSSPLAKTRDQRQSRIGLLADNMYDMPTSEISNLSIATYDEIDDHRRYSSSTGSVNRWSALVARERRSTPYDGGSIAIRGGAPRESALEHVELEELDSADKENLRLLGWQPATKTDFHTAPSASDVMENDQLSSSPSSGRNPKRIRVLQSSPRVSDALSVNCARSKASTPKSDGGSGDMLRVKRRRLDRRS